VAPINEGNEEDQMQNYLNINEITFRSPIALRTFSFQKRVNNNFIVCIYNIYIKF